ITRLLLNEFSLYPSQPLTIDQFQQLIHAVYTIAKNQQSNVHLLLSSVPVVMENKRTLNMSFYVQCGHEPVINIFSKGRASPKEVKYKSTSNYSQQSKWIFPGNISAHIALPKGPVVTNNSVFIARTEGGAEYTQAIDVCFDHYFRHSKELIKKSIEI